MKSFRIATVGCNLNHIHPEYKERVVIKTLQLSVPNRTSCLSLLHAHARAHTHGFYGPMFIDSVCIVVILLVTVVQTDRQLGPIEICDLI
jgi:hypothetical protein